MLEHLNWDEAQLRRWRWFNDVMLHLLSRHGGSETSGIRGQVLSEGAGAKSYHLLRNGGVARDVVFPSEAKKKSAMAEGQSFGLDVVDEGDHVHFELDRRAWPLVDMEVEPMATQAKSPSIRPPANRPIYKRLTIIFGALFAAASSLEPAGVVQPGTTEAAATALTQIASSFGVLVGLYRQIAN